MSFYFRETKCFVEVFVCSYFQKTIKKLFDSSSLLNISIVKIIDVEPTNGNEFVTRGKFAFYIPEEPHLKPALEDKLWVSSKSLINYFDTNTNKPDITDACNNLLRIITWYLSWNPTLEFPTSRCNMANNSPFPICIVSSSLILGYLLGYPYFLRNMPVSILVFDGKDGETSTETRKEYSDSIKMIAFSDVSSTIKEVMGFTQELGFSSIVIGPLPKISEDIILKIVLGSISVNGTIVSFQKIEHLSDFECSVLFQKKCNLMFSGLNLNPINWISKLFDEDYSDMKKMDLFKTMLEDSIYEDGTTKVGNELAYALAKSF
ncbi:hypothetical protein FG379_000696 [Cryptosporidium bovis]|uniref:uncharacterized protein n=1 Tax=Cryptosporidium bovis TaxID=310047 RepID=UPI00351A67CC|nr:hypothetical protein FG379_000696 [Cryptosporidium bovis]